MEFKYVAKTRAWSGVIPFSNDARRFCGTGKVVEKQDGDKTKYLLHQYDSSLKRFVFIGNIDRVLSEIKDDDFVNFIQIEDAESNTCLTYVWLESEFSVYIVNDNGKTVERI